jgi:preprotein translocase subunit SecG
MLREAFGNSKKAGENASKRFHRPSQMSLLQGIDGTFNYFAGSTFVCSTVFVSCTIVLKMLFVHRGEVEVVRID